MSFSLSSAPAPSLCEIVLCVDAGYRQHLTAMMASVVAGLTRPDEVRFWLLTDPESAAALRPLADEWAGQGVRMQILAQSLEDLPKVSAGSHMSDVTNLRLRLGSLLPVDLSRVLYLDADLIVIRPVLELWNTPLASGTGVAAVANAGTNRAETLGYPGSLGYFNAGVLLIDLDWWRAEGVEKQLFAYAASPRAPTPYIDQDALNWVCQGRWTALSAHWNLQWEHYLVPAGENGVPPESLADVLAHPALVHFTGPCKPWHFRDDHPHREVYFQALARTPYAGWRPRPAGWRDWARRWARLIVPFRWRTRVYGWWGAQRA